MTAAAQPEPTPEAVAVAPSGHRKPTAERLSASDRLERVLGRDLATVLVRGLARRLR